MNDIDDYRRPPERPTLPPAARLDELQHCSVRRYLWPSRDPAGDDLTSSEASGEPRSPTSSEADALRP